MMKKDVVFFSALAAGWIIAVALYIYAAVQRG
jgi:hypothetical protein